MAPKGVELFFSRREQDTEAPLIGSIIKNKNTGQFPGYSSTEYIVQVESESKIWSEIDLHAHGYYITSLSNLKVNDVVKYVQVLHLNIRNT